MNKAICISAIAAFAIACGSGSKTTQQTAAGSQLTQGNTTVTGCLARADETTGSVGTSGSAAASSGSGSTATPPAGAVSTPPANERFVLRQPSPTASPSSGAVGTAGNGNSYNLDGDTSELRNHVGQQVEVVGRIDSSGSTIPGQRLIVTSVRTVSDTCVNP